METQLHNTTKTNFTPTSAEQTNIEVTLVYPGQPLPKEYEDLRKLVYVNETGLVKEVFDRNDETLSHLLIYDSGKLIASLTLGAAEDSDISEWSNLSEEKLKQCAIGTRGVVHPDHRHRGLYRFMTYATGSYYRRQGRKRIIAYSELGASAAKAVLSDSQIAGSKIRSDQDGYQLECIEADINFAMWKAFAGMTPDLQKSAIQVFTRDEIEFYSKTKIQEFYRSPFYRAVIERTLTRQQYLEVLANTHSYVLWTTRILASLLRNIRDESVFKEISHHLVEEIGHPAMVINDMQQAGATKRYIEFVQQGMVANHRIDAFMSTQEAAVSFRSDPIAFMGVPIAIEGITAFMPKEFIDQLQAQVESWGVKDPAKATTFFASHLIFDNPHNGHWARMIKLVQANVQTERQVRQILNNIDNVIENVAAGYSQAMESVLS